MTKWIFEQTELFEKNFKKIIPKEVQEEFKKQIEKLITNNPYSSKPLGFKFFREKKVKKWRIYFLIYEKYSVLYFINLSDKKLQNKTIEIIKKELDPLHKYIKEKYSK